MNRNADPIIQLAIEGDSHVEWLDGNFQDDEAHKTRRLETDATVPYRINRKKFGR